MHLPRLFIDFKLESNESVDLSDDASRHVSKVLRMKPGDRIQLFNGRGGYYDAEIITVGKRAVTVMVMAFVNEETESNLKITLAQGISRGQRMDYTIQKAVELGVMQLVPLVTEYSSVKLDGERIQNRLRHWRAVIINACEQCRRTRIPDVIDPVVLTEWVNQDSSAIKLILVPGSTQRFKDIIVPVPSLSLLSGPEGGLSDAEISRAISAGYREIGLGPRILRTETAAVAAINAAQVLWGDMG